jgi:hypothetical protein
MLHHIFNTIKSLPMVWDLIVPLGLIAMFCVVLFWEGEYGKASKKHYRVRFKDLHH